MIFRVTEVLNYGGFFAGDTITLTAKEAGKPDEERTFTIDQGVLTNVGGDRYKVLAGMALDLQTEGEHVSVASVVGAKDRAALRGAVVLPPQPLNGPRMFSYYCKQCDLWILGEPKDGKCAIEGHAL